MTVVVETHADWLFLSKPAGLPVFPRHDGTGSCLLDALREEVPEQAAINWPDGFAGGIVHRLDVWTSGLVVAARSLDALEEARELFSSGSLRKRYVFLTNRSVRWARNVVDHPLAHAPKDKRKMVWKRGRHTPHRGRWYPAATRFEHLDRHGRYDLWGATISTGVMHQIRLHAASCGLALLGDRLYGGTGVPARRFYLHACRIDGWPTPTPDLPIPADWPR